MAGRLQEVRRRRAHRRDRRRHRRDAHGNHRARRTVSAFRRVALATIGLGLVVALAWTAVVVQDARAIASDLRVVRAELDHARAAIREGAPATATEHLTRVRADLSRTFARTGRPLWRVGEQVPLAGRSLRMLADVAETADTATALARDLTASAEDLLSSGGRLVVTTTDDRIDLAPLRQVRDALSSPRVDRLTQDLQRLEATPTRFVPAELLEARAELLELGERARTDISRARDIASLLPALLGDGEPRVYFLGMQNPAELRGTGGLIGFYATVEASDGRLVLSEPASYSALDTASQDIDTMEASPVSSEFDARYGALNPGGFLANANVDPDLRTVGPVVLDLYERAEGRALDGVILIDPVGLRDILEPIGPVTVPDGVEVGSLPNPLSPEQLPRTVMLDAYDVLGGATEERRTYLRELASAAFARIFAGGWDAVPVTEQVATTALDGHLQVYSTDPDVQEAAERLGVAGALRPPESADWLALVANNAAGNKGDLFARHRLRGDIELSEPDAGRAVRSGALSIDVVNDLPARGHDPYVNSSYTPGRAFIDTTTGPRGLNRTWFTVWSERDTIVTAGGELEPLGSWVLGDRRGTDWTLETPSGRTGTLDATVVGPVDLRQTADGHLYSLRLHRQPKATADEIDLRVHAPPGWRVVDAGLDGGGDGEGVGLPAQPPRPLQVRVQEDHVIFEGGLTRSVDLRVVVAPR